MFEICEMPSPDFVLRSAPFLIELSRLPHANINMAAAQIWHCLSIMAVTTALLGNMPA